MLTAASEDTLARKIEKARIAYYRGHPILTDADYDKLEEELRARNPAHPILKHSGAVVPTKMKVRLPFPMPSLTKKKQGFDEWAADYPGPYVVSWKIDGISALKDDRKASKLYTRGRSGNTEGGDISFLLPYLGLPQKDGTVVRGELVMRNSTFASKWSTEFANPRNMAAGLTNRKTVHPAVADMTFMVFELIEPRMKPSAALARAKALGYTVVPHKVYPKLTEQQLLKLLAAARANGRYEVDGLVIAQDRKTPVSKTDPEHTIAFKADSQDEAAITVITKLEWRETRTGYWFPRIHVKPVRLKGATVGFASAKSAAFVRDNKLGVGAKIRLRRSGDVIPDLRPEDVLSPGRVTYPKSYEWDGAHIRVPKADGQSQDVRVKRLEHFFVTLGIERFKAATIEKYVEAGFDTPRKILRMTAAQFSAVEGVSSTSKVIYQQVQKLREGVELPALMYASGLFGRSLGSRKFQAIVNAVPDILKKAHYTPQVLTRLVDDIPGFDLKQAAAFAVGLPKFLKFFTALNIPLKRPQRLRTVSKKLQGVAVLFTQFRDAELEKLIVENGGTLASTVRTATVLLTKDPGGDTAKLNAARELGTKIMTGDQFRRKYAL